MVVVNPPTILEPKNMEVKFIDREGDIWRYSIMMKDKNKNSWDIKCLKLCKELANIYSKDPSTKVGASIYRPDRSLCSMGFNGFPKGIEDSDERLEYGHLYQYYGDNKFKQQVIIHAEANALLKAYESVKGYTMYVWPVIPCPHNCASLIINSGIKRVVAPNKTRTNGGSDLSLTIELFEEAGVDLDYLEIGD